MDIGLHLRPWQHQIMNYQKELDCQFLFLLTHRQAGKTTGVINFILKSALENKKSYPVYLAVYPEQKQGINVVLKYYRRIFDTLIKAGFCKVLKTGVVTIDKRLTGQEITIRIASGKDIDRYRGEYFDGIYLDEYDYLPEDMLTATFLVPVIGRNGWVIVSSTPKGRHNMFRLENKIKEERAQGIKDWGIIKLDVLQSGVFTEEQIALMKRQMPKALFEQEMMMSYDVKFSNTIYGDCLEQGEKDRRYSPTVAQYNPKYPVLVGSDFGRDGTAFVFSQIIEGKINIIDFWQKVLKLDGSPATMDEAIMALYNSNYPIYKIYLPPDATDQRINADYTIQGKLEKAGFKTSMFVPKGGGQPSIDAQLYTCKMMFHRIHINMESRGKKLREALNEYRYKVSSDGLDQNLKPEHGNYSHAADALRCLLIGIGDPDKPEFLRTMDSKTIDRKSNYNPYSQRNLRENGGKTGKINKLR